MSEYSFKMLSLEDAITEAQNAIYMAVIPVLAALERDGLIHGNSHHAAQKLAANAINEIGSRWTNADYAVKIVSEQWPDHVRIIEEDHPHAIATPCWGNFAGR